MLILNVPVGAHVPPFLCLSRGPWPPRLTACRRWAAWPALLLNHQNFRARGRGRGTPGP